MVPWWIPCAGWPSSPLSDALPAATLNPCRGHRFCWILPRISRQVARPVLRLRCIFRQHLLKVSIHAGSGGRWHVTRARVYPFTADSCNCHTSTTEFSWHHCSLCAMVTSLQDCIFLKRPGMSETNWHSDVRLTPLDTNDFLTFWIPLRPIRAQNDSALEFAQRSHRDMSALFWRDPGELDFSLRNYRLQNTGAAPGHGSNAASIPRAWMLNSHAYLSHLRSMERRPCRSFFWFCFVFVWSFIFGSGSCTTIRASPRRLCCCYVVRGSTGLSER